MKKATSKLLLFFFCMSFLMVIPQKVNAAEIIPVNISVKYGQNEARTIFNMINEMRTSSTDAWYWNEDDTTKTTCSGLNELAYDYDLERLAMKRAAEIALSYSHTRPNGGRSFSIYSEEGITNWRAVGENIAAGYLSAEAVNMGWREDNENYAGQGHRRNMLSADFNCVGIGHVYYNGYHYWVEEFAYRTSVNTTETAANDSEQSAALSVDSSKITGFKAIFDKTSYTLRAGESTEVNLTKSMITVSGQWPVGVDRIVTDTPTISVDNVSIASYNIGKISGVAEGTTTLTASLYGLTATDMPTVSVHECDKHWNQGEVTIKPTCVKEGEKTFTCIICGNTKTEKVSATENHSWNAGEITKEPSCTEKGTKKISCTVCGESKTEEIASLGHEKSTDRLNHKAATCEAEGYTGDIYCTRCREILENGSSIPATGHSFGEYEVVKEPTSSEEGLKSRTCSTCGKVESVTIPKIENTDQKETETKDTDKDQKETEVKDPDKDQKETETKDTDKDQKETETKDTDKDQKETETKDTDKNQQETETKAPDKDQQQTETPDTKPNQEQKPQTVKKTTKKIKLNRKKLTLKKGKTFKLKVTLTPKDSQDKIVYRTSNRKVATVSKNGKIKAKKKGKANITVISGKKKAVCKVTVK